VAGVVFDTDNADYPSLTIGSVQPLKDGLLVTLDGVTDRNAADKLRGTSFLIEPSERRTLESEEFWPEQLIGLQVVDPAGTEVGTVADVVGGGVQHRLLVTAAGGQFEVPFVAAIVTEVDIPSGRIVIDAPEGLLE
jgi:16S rRNA processing protein RimM